jgi:hypothetical protein
MGKKRSPKFIRRFRDYVAAYIFCQRNASMTLDNIVNGFRNIGVPKNYWLSATAGSPYLLGDTRFEADLLQDPKEYKLNEGHNTSDYILSLPLKDDVRKYIKERAKKLEKHKENKVS